VEAIKLRDAFVVGVLAQNPILKMKKYGGSSISIIADDGSGVVNAVFNVDIYCNLNQPFFSHYQNFFNENSLTQTSLKHPIPYVSQKKIRYATCGWIYFDAIRQMVANKKEHEKFPDSPAALAAYAASVARFTRLYINMNKYRIDDVSLATLYDQVREITIYEAGNMSDNTTLTNALAVLKKGTNIEKVERQLVAPPAYAECTKRVIGYLLKGKKGSDSILGKYMQKYNTADYYPAVVGGATLTRCLGELYKRKGIRIDIKDIDMPISVRTDLDISQVVQIRNQYLAEIIEDADLLAFVADLGARHNLIITFQVEVLPSTAHEKLWSVRLAIVKLRFQDNAGRFLHGVNIIDCPIYTQESRYSDKRWHTYDLVKNVEFRDPMPFYVDSKKVVHATCGYVKYDTFQMLLVCQHELETLMEQSPPNTRLVRLWFYKYLKYLAKYAALYKKTRAFNLARALLTNNDLLEMQLPNQAKLDEILASFGKDFKERLDIARRKRDAS
jgi:hypothetical protein